MQFRLNLVSFRNALQATIRTRSSFRVVGTIGLIGYCSFLASSAADHSETKDAAKPSRNDYAYVICGAGPAGISALTVLQEHADPSTNILLLAPDIRVQADPGAHTLSQSLLINTTDTMLPVTEVLLGSKVTQIDPVHRIASLSSGVDVSFQKLLLAVGGDVESFRLARIVAPGAESMAGFVQCPESAAKLQRLFDHSQLNGHSGPSPHVTVVGGSWAAACLVSQLVGKGAAVTYTFAEPAFLARHFPRYISDELVRRLIWASDDNFETIGYSVLSYITPEVESVERRRDPEVAEPEAAVHFCLIFDQYAVASFRTDFVMFAPTMLHAPSLARFLPVDQGGRLVSNPELSVYTDIYAAGSCLASMTPSDQRHSGYWSALRAEETGRHAAWNMLGKREPYEETVPGFSVDMSSINLRVYCAGAQDGNAETYGFFLRSGDRIAPLSGGQLSSGIIFYVRQSALHSGQVHVVGISIWDGDVEHPVDESNALRAAKRFLRSSIYNNRHVLEVAMRNLCEQILSNQAGEGNENILFGGRLGDTGEHRRTVRRHIQPRKVPIKDKEEMWLEAEQAVLHSGETLEETKAKKFDALLRQSAYAKSSRRK